MNTLSTDTLICDAFEAGEADDLDRLAREFPSKAAQCQLLAADLRRVYTPADAERCRISMAAMASLPEEKL